MVAHLLQQIDANLIRLEVLLLQLHNIVSGSLDLFLQRLALVHEPLIFCLEFADLLNKHINVRLLLFAHLFEFRYVGGLIAAHLFQQRNGISLLLPYLLQALVALVRAL